MVYKSFLQIVKNSLTKQLGEGYDIHIRQIPKNNGILLDGLSIERPPEPVSPTIYLNSYYDQYLKGMTLQEVTDDILFLYQSHRSSPLLNADQISSFPQIKDKIAFKLINAGLNTEQLKDTPHIKYLDLAIIFYLYLGQDEAGTLTSTIQHEHLKLWGITKKELFFLARENTPRLLPASINNMSDLLKQIAKANLGEEYDEDLINRLLDDRDETPPLYILTNETEVNGAACILYNEILKNFADQTGTDLIILPSSIHEVLLAPDNGYLSYEYLIEMVSDINRTEVPQEDRLSDQIYLYSRADDSISVISSSPTQVSEAFGGILPPTRYLS